MQKQKFWHPIWGGKTYNRPIFRHQNNKDTAGCKEIFIPDCFKSAINYKYRDFLGNDHYNLQEYHEAADGNIIMQEYFKLNLEAVIMKSKLFFACVLLISLYLVGCDHENEAMSGQNNKSTKETSTTMNKDNISENKHSQSTASKAKTPSSEQNPRILFETTMGNITIELDSKSAPVTVDNYLRYVNEGFFDNTIFHRVISNFMIQGGGFGPDMVQKPSHSAIINEGSNGLKNDRGTIAMARTNDPDSATSQFFINVNNNSPLNYTGPGKPGYAVFGKVVDGMDVVDAIVHVETTTREAMTINNIRAQFQDVPDEPIIIKTAKIIDNN